jgi:hypothetical protein
MSELEETLEPGRGRAVRLREAVVQAARRFKSTWVELGRLLVAVRRENLFEQWGYDSFEAYCAKELHIRRQTALKLTRSFSFLDKHEPRRMAADDASIRAPSFEVVEVLAQAEERGQLSSDEYRTIRESIWDPARAPSELKRELSARFPQAPPDRDHALGRLAQTARRLANELRAVGGIPRAIGEHAASLADELERLAGAEPRNRSQGG